MGSIIVKVVRYCEKRNELFCEFPSGKIHCVDPFVGGVIEQSKENFSEVGKSMVGKQYTMIGDDFVHNAFLPDKFTEKL